MGSFHGNMLTSDFGASIAASMATAYGCAGMSSGRARGPIRAVAGGPESEKGSSVNPRPANAGYRLVVPKSRAMRAGVAAFKKLLNERSTLDGLARLGLKV